MIINTYQQALAFLNSLRPKNRELKFPGELGLKRARYLLKLLGGPQNKIKVIHIAGTSGKGSTAYLTSIALKSQGFKVGLTLSPHLLDIRERIQINNLPISQAEFYKLLNQITSAIAQTKKTELGTPTFFEVLVAMAFTYFYQQQVDYAVIETGLGGLFDGTNIIETANKIAIITKIGFDHVQILGPTLKDIALQKAGIIHKRNLVITTKQQASVQNVLKTKADQEKVKLIEGMPELNYHHVHLSSNKTQFDFSNQHFSLPKINLGLIGNYQAENCSLALTCLSELAKRDQFKIEPAELRNTLAAAKFPGRFDILHYQTKTMILDGSHNPQKTSAFISNLKLIFPQEKFNFLFAVKQNKEYPQMLKLVAPLANKIIFTSFVSNDQDMRHKAIDPNALSKFLQTQKFKNYQIIENNASALKQLLQSKDLHRIVITGSLYLLSNIYLALKNFNKKSYN